MKLDDIRANIGNMVMTTDPGHKLIPSGRIHGPYKLEKLTKAGLVRLENYEFSVRPSNIYEIPNATDQ